MVEQFSVSLYMAGHYPTQCCVSSSVRIFKVFSIIFLQCNNANRNSFLSSCCFVVVALGVALKLVRTLTVVVVAIYGASPPELTVVQNFLRRCFKRKYISYLIDMQGLVDKTDYAIFKKVSNKPSHPLFQYLPKTKQSSYYLRNKSSLLPSLSLSISIKTLLLPLEVINIKS